MKFKLPILLLLLNCINALGQDDTLRFSVRGVVRDADTGKPLQSVGVSIPGTRIAVITNADGTFVIKSPQTAESLDFSLLGYRRLRQECPENSDRPMSVRMVRSDFTLEAATVMTGDPLSILSLAIRKIGENSPSSPELFDCFYRETVRKRQRFIYVSEAVTRVFKAPSSELFVPDRAAVVKSRLLTSPRASDTLGVKVLGGPVMAVDLDVVRQRCLILDEYELQNYKLEMLLPEMIGDRMQFVISFTPDAEPGYALDYGKVYIDRETLAFTRIELSLDMSDPDLATRAMLVQRPTGLRFRPKEMSLVLNYSMDGGKARLSYLRTVFRFNCDWRKKLFATEFTAVSEMVVTNRHDGDAAVRIPREEAFKSRDALADKTGLYLDPDFWAGYNIIEPTTSLEHAIGRLKRE